MLQRRLAATLTKLTTHFKNPLISSFSFFQPAKYFSKNIINTAISRLVPKCDKTLNLNFLQSISARPHPEIILTNAINKNRHKPPQKLFKKRIWDINEFDR